MVITLLLTIINDIKKIKSEVEESSALFSQRRNEIHSKTVEARKRHELKRKNFEEKFSRYSK